MPDRIGEFLATHDWNLLRTIKGWQVERDATSLDVVRLMLPARDGERFTVRFICNGYPAEAPSVTFIGVNGSSSERTAWPRGNVHFCQVVKPPPHSFLCTDLTREGFAHHPEWRGNPNAWKSSTHTLMDLFNYIQDDLLNSANYEGRIQ